MSESYVIQDGQPLQNPDSTQDYIDFPPLNLSESQFPCGATYDGDDAGAQPVVVPYSWCRQNCGGWEKSTNAALSQWVQPFVGFILPAAVFCLNVPRKSMIGIWDGFFKDHFDELPGAVKDLVVELAFVLHFFPTIFFKKRKLERLRNWIDKETREGSASKHGLTWLIVLLFKLLIIVSKSFFIMLFRATFADGIALVNTIIWTAVVFSAAGPMILSGLYEASLDRKVIRSILGELKTEKKRAKKEVDEVSPKSSRERRAEREVFYKRVHQLYAVLVGNLQLPDEIKDEPEKPRSVWKDVNHLVKAPKLLWSKVDDSASEENGFPTRDDQIEHLPPAEVDPEVDEQTVLGSDYRKITDTRLKGMLDCQASFGAAVGAPVVFFVGSYLFGVISNLSVVGDNDTSHALAFGMWWMTIPHVAIVAGCLLAGNNPNTLEIIISSEKIGPWEESDEKERRGFHKFYLPFYQSVYVPVEMWARGKNKKLWIDELFFRYGASPTSKDAEGRGKYVARHDKGEFHFDLWDWISLINITIVLMVLPFVLAFITSYYTPTVGLSCRTFTFLLYFVFQVCLGVIWLVDFFRPFKWTQQVAWLPFATYAGNTVGQERRSSNEKGEENEIGTVGEEVVEYVTKTRKNARTLMGLLLGFMFLGSMFTTVIGTFLQILSVYRNCLCSIPINYWVSGDCALDISTNTADAIRLAKVF